MCFELAWVVLASLVLVTLVLPEALCKLYTLMHSTIHSPDYTSGKVLSDRNEEALDAAKYKSSTDSGLACLWYTSYNFTCDKLKSLASACTTTVWPGCASLRHCLDASQVPACTQFCIKDSAQDRNLLHARLDKQKLLLPGFSARLAWLLRPVAWAQQPSLPTDTHCWGI